MGHMEGRFHDENIRPIGNGQTSVLYYLQVWNCNFENKPDLFVCLRQKIGLGEVFRKWISVLYTDIETSISNNGCQSEYLEY